jgi:hypothetical protein
MEHIYDFIHGYQPSFVFKEWFLENMEKIFLPTSESIKEGIIKRHIQLQGWTLDLAQNLENEQLKNSMNKIINNIKIALEKENCQIGFSAYSHAILPLCSDIVTYLQIKLDYETIKNSIGTPTWFFYPEGCVDKRTIEIVNEAFPKIIHLIPNKTLDNIKKTEKSINLQSDFFTIITNDDKKIKSIIYDVYVKDILMGAPYFEEKPDHIPFEIDWETAKKSMHEPGALIKTIDQILDSEKAKKIIVRDWENAESKKALAEIDKSKKEISAFIKAKELNIADFKLIDNIRFSTKESISIEQINPASWEPSSTKEDPFPFWNPSKKRLNSLNEDKQFLIKSWLKIVETYNFLFDNVIIDYCARRNIITKDKISELNISKKITLIETALKNKDIDILFKDTAPVLASCFPWHLATFDEWDNDVGLSLEMLEHNIKPKMKRLMDYYEYYVNPYENRKEFQEMLDEMSIKLKKIIEKMKYTKRY